ncbi:MAG: hypothetical protein QGH60_20045 [Phycisphaerae bacterium]|jgi:hypothetical protein|nr:hypothetical protein [Phycisphaerae bacterium]
MDNTHTTRRGFLANLSTGAIAAIALPAAGATRPASGNTLKYAFVCSGNGGVWRFTRDGKRKQLAKARKVNDLSVLPNGNVLYADRDFGVREVDANGKVVFELKVDGEVHGVGRLADGTTVIGECGAMKIHRVDAKGKAASEPVVIVAATKNAHRHMRNFRRLDNGNYLVCHEGDSRVREYDPKGKVVLDLKSPSPFAALRLKNGGTLVSGGPGKVKITEFDKKQKVVWQLRGGELKGVKMGYAAGLQVLAGGNIVLCNHSHRKGLVPLLEITRDKKLAWSFDDKEMKEVSSCHFYELKNVLR